MAAGKRSGPTRLDRLRRRYSWFDHLLRAATRYQEVNGSRLAAACTYFGFLAVFPLILLIFAVLGYLFQNHPAVTRTVSDALSQNLPVLRIEDIQQARNTAGVIGLIGFFFAGLGWVNVCRTSLRTLWGVEPAAGNMIRRRAGDALVLIGLGLVVGVSLAVSALTSGTAEHVLGWFGADDSTGGRIVLSGLGFVLTIAVNTVLFMVGFIAVPRIRQPVRRLFWPSLLSAVGFGALSTVGTLYISRTQANPAYQAVAVAAGLLVFLYLLHQLVIFAAALNVTDRFSRPVIDLEAGPAENHPGSAAGPAGGQTGVSSGDGVAGDGVPAAERAR